MPNLLSDNLHIYNTLSRKKELFSPLSPPFVGMYVCGPTVYNEVHLGNCRTFVIFDMIYRYLRYLGYNVRYVRNITDVGHLTSDHDSGEDKISKRAKLEQLEPMEVVQKYTYSFHSVMRMLNTLPPSIEPSATAHIPEQIAMTSTLLKNKMAYVSNGSVYFDVGKYMKQFDYGILSGKKVEDLQTGTRSLAGKGEKKSTEDFALWKKASPEHIMRWDSPWSVGFPGWHLECSVMSSKYIGKEIDIHGGGMDLKFPHHECEIAQSQATYKKQPVKYWLHTNMLTVNGEQMSKSKGNGVLPAELFAGKSHLGEQPFSPMTLRFLILQTHYRSTTDLSINALKAAEKGYLKLINGLKILKGLTYPDTENLNDCDQNLINALQQSLNKVKKSMKNDFNTALAITHLLPIANRLAEIKNKGIPITAISKTLFADLQKEYAAFVKDVLGFQEEGVSNVENLIDALMPLYQKAREEKNYAHVDQLRTLLASAGVAVRDGKSGSYWIYEGKVN